MTRYRPTFGKVTSPIFNHDDLNIRRKEHQFDMLTDTEYMFNIADDDITQERKDEFPYRAKLFYELKMKRIEEEKRMKGQVIKKKKVHDTKYSFFWNSKQDPKVMLKHTRKESIMNKKKRQKLMNNQKLREKLFSYKSPDDYIWMYKMFWKKKPGLRAEDKTNRAEKHNVIQREDNEEEYEDENSKVNEYISANRINFENESNDKVINIHDILDDGAIIEERKRKIQSANHLKLITPRLGHTQPLSNKKKNKQVIHKDKFNNIHNNLTQPPNSTLFITTNNYIKPKQMTQTDQNLEESAYIPKIFKNEQIKTLNGSTISTIFVQTDPNTHYETLPKQEEQRFLDVPRRCSVIRHITEDDKKELRKKIKLRELESDIENYEIQENGVFHPPPPEFKEIFKDYQKWENKYVRPCYHQTEYTNNSYVKKSRWSNESKVKKFIVSDTKQEITTKRLSAQFGDALSNIIRQKTNEISNSKRDEYKKEEHVYVPKQDDDWINKINDRLKTEIHDYQEQWGTFLYQNGKGYYSKNYRNVQIGDKLLKESHTIMNKKENSMLGNTKPIK